MTATTDNERIPSFATLLNEVDGIFANARITYSLTTIDRAMDHGEWTRAIDMLARLADRVAGVEVPREAWRELLYAAAWFGVMADDVDAAAPILERSSHRAWPSSRPDEMPWKLADALEEADRRGRFAAGKRLGDLVATIFPTCPLGNYAAAHFADRLHQHGQADSPAAERAAQFERAAQLADAVDEEALAKRAHLRAGVALLRSSTDRERGRALLRQIDPAELSRADSLWYAVGMAHSPFWLDRVRAADQVIAVAEGDDEPAQDTRGAARYLLDCAPIELQPLEIDRLDGLADELGIPTDLLSVRKHLEGVAAAPLARAGEAADLLAQSLAEEASEAQLAAIEFCRAVAGIFDGDEATEPDEASIARLRDSFPIGALVVEALPAVVAGDVARLATSLGELEGRFHRDAKSFARADLKPVALLWPHLLPLIRRLDEDGDVDATTRRRVTESTGEILARWLPDAPAPSYGWWNLAANLQACAMHEQAARAARRAIDDGESVDPDLERRVIATVLDRVIRDGSPTQMLEWLERADSVVH